MVEVDAVVVQRISGHRDERFFGVVGAGFFK